MKDDNWENVYKTINVLKTVYKDQNVKINQAMSSKRKKKKLYNKDLEKRTNDLKAALEAYDVEDTYEVKLRKLHIIASKIAVDVSIDVTDENASLNDE